MLQPMQRYSLALAALALGCEVRELPPPTAHTAAAPCRSGGDCSSGSCQTELGVCNTPSGAIDAVLFEIVPQTTDPRYGSARFYIYQAGLASSSNEPLLLNIPERVPVQGQIVPAPEQQPCARDANSLPVSLTFTPREQLWGISVPSYSFDAERDAATDEFRFFGSLPPGRYDVYMRAKPGYGLPSACNLAPQVFRDVPVGLEAESATAALTPVQRSLQLSMAWRDELEGWNVDMVHPVTGEIISTRSTLQRIRVVDRGDGPVIEPTLHYSLGGEKDFIREGEELVRLTPPPAQERVKGVVLLQREGLELVTPGRGTIGDVTTFGAIVKFQSWIFANSDDDRPIVGSVSFAATSLTGTVGGVDASFTGTVPIGALGDVQVDLLPGTYRMRVTPAPGDGLAANEYPIVVQPGVPTQGGGVIPVPRAARVDGIALSPSGAPLRGVEVVLNASSQPLDGCAAETSLADPLCDRPRATVLQRALGEDPFVPRSRTALTSETGAFGGIEADCGGCERFGPGAGFDITLRPPPETGLPWLLRPATRVTADLDLDVVQFPLPVTRPVRVTFGAGGSLEVLPGALVTAYVLLDAESRPINDPFAVPPCLGARVEDPVCIQSAVPIAEGRSDPDRDLWLLLPPSLE